MNAPMTVGLLVGLALVLLRWPSTERRGDGSSSGDDLGPLTGGSGAPRRRRHGGAGRARRSVATEATPDAVAAAAELLALALGAGCGIVEAMEAVGARTPGAVGASLRTVAAATRWGLADDAAWALVGAVWEPVGRSLRLASSAGVAPARLLTSAAADLRAAEDHRLELATARLRVLVVLPLGLCFLPAFVCTTVVPVVLALTRQVLGG